MPHLFQCIFVARRALFHVSMVQIILSIKSCSMSDEIGLRGTSEEKCQNPDQLQHISLLPQTNPTQKYFIQNKQKDMNNNSHKAFSIMCLICNLERACKQMKYRYHKTNKLIRTFFNFYQIHNNHPSIPFTSNTVRYFNMYQKINQQNTKRFSNSTRKISNPESFFPFYYWTKQFAIEHIRSGHT